MDEVTISDRGTMPRAVRAVLGCVLFGGTGFVMLHNWLGLGGPSLDDVTGGWLYDTVVVSAGLACLLRALDGGPERNAWIWIGAAVLAWGAGEIYWALYIVDDPAPPYPSPADIGYLAFYPLAYVGLWTLVRARASELDWRLWTDGLIASLGTAALGTLFVFDFVAERTNGTPAQVATSLAYPLADIGMIALIVAVIALSGWRPGRTWSLLLAALGAMVVADIAYSIQGTNGVVPQGNWIDPVYLTSAAFFGALMWQPSAASIDAPQVDTRRELMVPAIFAALMTGTAGVQYLSGSSSLSTALWLTTMVAVILRLGLAVRQNRGLLEEVQTDPLTGLGNRGRMQVELEAQCARATEERPVAFFLLDLNGFKLYNDTFGHPAGDRLLTQLGDTLREAVGEDGTAYRIGGDEFGVLLICEEGKFESLAGKAAEALTASDRGVEVAASWGGVVIPREARTRAAVLQLADMRMYAQKEERRRAARGGAWRRPLSPVADEL